MTVRIIRDENGTLHRVPLTQPFKTSRGRQLDGSPHIDVWWDRDPVHKYDEMLLIRQESFRLGDPANVVMCSLAQAMDLMKALALATSKP